MATSPPPDLTDRDSERRRKKIHLRVALGVLAGLVAVAALSLRALYVVSVGTPAHPMTVAGLEARLRAETPIGSDRERVFRWLSDSRSQPEFSFSEGRGSGLIRAMIRDTYRSVACRGQIEISWYFDPAGKLTGFRAVPADECL